MKKLPADIPDAISPNPISKTKLVIDVHSPRGLTESYSASFGNQSPIRIQANSHQEYHLLFNVSKHGPQTINTAREENDLIIYVGNKHSLIATVVITDYFLYPNQYILGLDRDSQWHQYPINDYHNNSGEVITHQLSEQLYEPTWLDQKTAQDVSFYSKNKYGLIAGGLLGLGGVAAIAKGTDKKTSSQPNNEGKLSIIGKAKESETLTANISDKDGVPSENIRYQWLRNNENISDANKSTYKLVQADVGKTISVKVSYIDNAENRESLTSDSTEKVVNTNNAPEITIEGKLEQNQVLKAVVTDEDGLPKDPSKISYTWFANNVEISSDKTAELKLSQNEVGKTITVQASYTDAFDYKESVRSKANENTVKNVNDPGVVTISGKLQPNEVLEAKVTDPDGIYSFSLRYQWYADNTAIKGANTNKYTLTSNDIGKSFSVKVSYNDKFNTSENITSISTDKVVKTLTTAKSRATITLDDLMTSDSSLYSPLVDATHHTHSPSPSIHSDNYLVEPVTLFTETSSLHSIL